MSDFIEAVDLGAWDQVDYSVLCSRGRKETLNYTHLKLFANE